MFLCLSPSDENITSNPGEDVTLPCVGPTEDVIKAVEWINPGHNGSNVFLWRGDDRPDVEKQHPSYEDRVELVDPLMRNKNVSLIIKNVTINDTGTYECHIYNGTMDDSIKNNTFGTRPIRIINLEVEDKSKVDVELIVIASVVGIYVLRVIIVIIIVIVVIVKKYCLIKSYFCNIFYKKCNTQEDLKSNQPSAYAVNESLV